MNKLVMIAVAFLLPCAAKPQNYQVIDLGSATTLSSDGAAANISINNDGWVAWTSLVGPSPSSAMLWVNGATTSINAGTPVGISDSGSIVGSIGRTYQNGEQPFIYQSGHTTTFRIPTDSGSSSYAVGGVLGGVNSTGIAVGYCYDSPFRSSTDSKGFYYQNGVATYLSGGIYTIGGYTYQYAHANAINNAGTIVGNVSDHSGSVNDPGLAVAWFGINSSPLDLGAGLGGRAVAVSSDNKIIGYNAQGGGFLWDNGQIRLFEGGFAPTSINSLGEVLGHDNAGHLILWQDDVYTDISDLFIATNIHNFGYGAINDSGQVVSLGINDAGQQHAFLLNPIPESTTLLPVGLIVLVVWRKVRKP